MFDIKKELQERGLTEELYEQLLNDCQKKTHREIDIDWVELSDKYNLGWSGDAIRKAAQIPLVGGTFVKEYYEQKQLCGDSFSKDEYLKKLEEKKREIKKETVKLQTEKVEYNKWLREDARSEMVVDRIINAIDNLDKLEIPDAIMINHSPKEYLLLVGDEHYGVEFEIKDLFGNVINSYSPEIFEERMNYLLCQLIELVEKENIAILNIFSLGDFADGVLRVSQLMKLRYGVIESTIKYAEYMANWLNTLSKFVKIKYQQCSGNHTELRLLTGKKGDFPDENMDKVLKVFLKERLKDNPNFVMVENPTGYAYAQLCGYTILGIHGEVKNMGQAINDFSRVYGFPIDYLVAGHYHHSRSEVVGIDSEVINAPSVIGVDPYSMSLKKTANAGATLLAFEKLKGKVCEYSIKLN